MQYVALQVESGKEARVAQLIDRHLKHRFELCGDEFLRGVQVLHLCKAVSTVGSRNRKSFVSQLGSYVYVGFKKWNDELYHLLKAVPGVYRILDHWRDKTFITQEEVDRMRLNNESELHLIIPDNDEAMEKAIAVLKKIATSTTWLAKMLVQKGKKTKNVLVLPFERVCHLIQQFAPSIFKKRQGDPKHPLYLTLDSFIQQIEKQTSSNLIYQNKRDLQKFGLEAAKGSSNVKGTKNAEANSRSNVKSTKNADIRMDVDWFLDNLTAFLDRVEHGA